MINQDEALQVSQVSSPLCTIGDGQLNNPPAYPNSWEVRYTLLDIVQVLAESMLNRNSHRRNPSRSLHAAIIRKRLGFRRQRTHVTRLMACITWVDKAGMLERQ